MKLVELIGKLVILGAVAAMGFHLVKNNRIITTNLLKTPGLFDTKEVKMPADRPIKKHKLILSRVMLYIIGSSFVLAGVIGAVVHLRRFFEGAT